MRDEQIAAANREALGLVLAGRPVVVDVRPAREVVPGMHERMVLHAGPPLPDGSAVAGALRGTLIGAALYEGWASTAEAAAALIDRGEVDMCSAHEHDSLGTYCGGISPSTPVWVVQNRAFGACAFNNFNEGRGRALRYGCFLPEVIERLRWIESTLAPLLAEVVRRVGGIELLPFMAQGLHMGDECHSRNKATSSLFMNRIAPLLASLDRPASDVRAAFAFLAENDIFFLNLAMAAAKSIMMAADGVPGSSLVTCMARNGVEFGIRVAGFRGRWFTAPVTTVDGAYFPGFSAADANPDMGDSAIVETLGLGAFAMAAAPALGRYMGGRPSAAGEFTEQMRGLVLAEHPELTVPQQDYRGVPTGIDARKVARSGITPVTNCGVAHRDGTTGQIGAGYVRTPLRCFADAARALEEAGTVTPGAGRRA